MPPMTPKILPPQLTRSSLPRCSNLLPLGGAAHLASGGPKATSPVLQMPSCYSVRTSCARNTSQDLSRPITVRSQRS